MDQTEWTTFLTVGATAFYTKHQFQPLVSRPQTLFLPMKTAQELVSTLGRRPRRSQSISGFA